MGNEEPTSDDGSLEKAVASIVDSLVDEIIAVSDGLGGSIDTAQIRNLAESYKESPASKKALEKCIAQIKASLPQADPKSRRQRVLERVLIGRIEGLFPTTGDLGRGRQIVSRRALPGLFGTIKSLIGPDRFQERSHVCDEVLTRHRAEKGDPVDWAAIERSPECNHCVDEALVLFAVQFEKREDRVLWLSERISEDLAAADEFLFEGGNVETWAMDKAAAQMLLRGLFASFLLKLAEPDGRHSLVERFDEEGVAAIERLLESLKGRA